MVVREKKDLKQKTVKEEKLPQSKPKPLQWAVGRRKCASARVRVSDGTGKITVNGRTHAAYFDTEFTRDIASFPFTVCPVSARYDFSVSVSGGGKVGQAEAVKLGISRLLLAMDPDIRPVLREHRLLRVNARRKERKKYGQRGARRKFQFVKR